MRVSCSAMQEHRTQGQPLAYATPERHRRTGPLIGRGPCVFMAICALLICWYGVYYLQAWSVFPEKANRNDLWLGVTGCATGVTLFCLSIYLFRVALRGRAARAPDR